MSSLPLRFLASWQAKQFSLRMGATSLMKLTGPFGAWARAAGGAASSTARATSAGEGGAEDAKAAVGAEHGVGLHTGGIKRAGTNGDDYRGGTVENAREKNLPQGGRPALAATRPLFVTTRQSRRKVA